MGEAAKISVDSPAQPSRQAFWPQGWWRILDFKIGIVPLPIYFVLVALIVAFVQIGNGKIASDLLTSIAILAVGGFTCGEIGKRLPVIKHLGAAAIFATFLPSYLVYAHLLPAPLIDSTKDFFKCPSGRFASHMSRLAGDQETALEPAGSPMIPWSPSFREVRHVEDCDPSPTQPRR